MIPIVKIAISLSLFVILMGVAVSAQPSIINVYESGAYPYVGSAGIKQAMSDVADPGTIYVHSGIYDLGATATSFLTVSKSLTLAGFDDGAGKPVIKGARPSGIAGAISVDAPDKVVVLENIEISFYGARPASADAVVYVRGSNSFTMQNCTITGAYSDGVSNRGIYASIRIEGIARSEFPVLPYPPTPTSAPNPDYPFRNNVKGDIKIRNSTLTGWAGNIVIGAFGPVSLDNIEVSGCTINVLGATQLGNWNRGNAGIVIAQYPSYMNDSNRLALTEATHAETRTIIRNNTIIASNLIALLYLKGVQLIEKNRLHSRGAWFTGGKYNQWGIRATGYPHDKYDPATYSEAVIIDNVIDLRVPPFPIPGAPPSVPPQTPANTSPPTGIWLGAKGSFYYALSSITGHYAKATVTGNIISSNAFSPSGPINHPDYCLYLASEMKDCTIARNYLAGGMMRDPIDHQVKLFGAFTAKISQAYVDAEAHDNTIHRNAFGPAGIAGVLCYGHDNRFENDHFYGNYVGWEPGPGLFWLTNTSYGNKIVATKLNGPPFGFDICRQIYDETSTGLTGYNGLNIIPGFERCGNMSTEFMQRMQNRKAEIEAQQAAFQSDGTVNE